MQCFVDKTIIQGVGTCLAISAMEYFCFVAIKSKLTLKPSCTLSTVTDCAMVERSKRETGVVRNIWSFASNSPCLLITGCLRQMARYIITFILPDLRITYVHRRILLLFLSTSRIKLTHYWKVLPVNPRVSFRNITDFG